MIERVQTLESVQDDHIRRVLESTRGNVVRSADLLGIGRKTLYRWLKRFPDLLQTVRHYERAVTIKGTEG
jgi:transcriptional regulator of acetoin/glycerol metabolism